MLELEVKNNFGILKFNETVDFENWKKIVGFKNE